jgi:cytoskeletal protein RodZ
VVKVDRSGLNEHHPVVAALYAAIDRVLKPVVADEERRASAHLVRPGQAVKARDQVGLRALNDALKNAFDTPGKAAFAPGNRSSANQPLVEDEHATGEADRAAESGEPTESSRQPATAGVIRFKQALVRLHPGERRGISLLIDPQQIPPETPITVSVDTGLAVTPTTDHVPEPNRSGWSRIDIGLRARVSCDPGAKLTVTAEAAGHTAELAVLIVRHHASGWVREIARKDEDSEIEATFDPESGTVTVYEGRKEFKALERAARRSGLPKARAREYLPYRMLEVEVAANTVYTWAAQQILARRLQDERPADPVDYTAAVQHEAQALRYRAHDKLMQAFLDEDVFEGNVRTGAPAGRRPNAQTSLLDDT